MMKNFAKTFTGKRIPRGVMKNLTKLKALLLQQSFAKSIFNDKPNFKKNETSTSIFQRKDPGAFDTFFL